MVQDDANIEEWNEVIKNYMIDFVDDFTSAGDKGTHVTLRKTSFEIEINGRMRMLPVEVSTTATKTATGLIRKISFHVVQKNNKA